MKSIRNEKGIGIIVPVIGIGLVILTLGTVLIKQYMIINDSGQRFKRAVAGQQMFQAFAQQALKANEQAQAGACPPDTTLTPTVAAVGVTQFCWPNAGSCIRDISNTANANAQVCMTVGGEESRSQFAIYRKAGKFDLMAAIEDHVDQSIVAVMNSWSNEANAQAPGVDPNLPVLVAPPANQVIAAGLTCTGALPGDMRCKRCAGTGAGLPTNLNCFRFRLCLAQDVALCNANNLWLFQRFGISTN